MSLNQLPERTNKSYSLAYGHLLGSMDPATHFVIVWDCDAAPPARALQTEFDDHAKVTPFTFRLNFQSRLDLTY